MRFCQTLTNVLALYLALKQKNPDLNKIITIMVR